MSTALDCLSSLMEQPTSKPHIALQSTLSVITSALGSNPSSMELRGSSCALLCAMLTDNPELVLEGEDLRALLAALSGSLEALGEDSAATERSKLSLEERAKLVKVRGGWVHVCCT